MRANYSSKSFILTLPVCDRAHAAKPARLPASVPVVDRDWSDIR